MLLAGVGAGSPAPSERLADRYAANPLAYLQDLVVDLVQRTGGPQVLADEICALAETGTTDELRDLGRRAALLVVAGVLMVGTATVLRRRDTRRRV